MPEPHPAAGMLAAEAWAEVQEDLDLQLSPLGLRAIEALAPQPGETILDVGCGTGQTLLQLADRVAPGGRVLGVDIAEHLVDLARQRTTGKGSIDVRAADAATLALADASVDGCFSRFGVMAFADPIAAFTNFHRIARPGGRLAFVCWRSLGDNELDVLPLRAAGLEDRVDPTPFSFEDPDRVRRILGAAGFRTVRIEADDQEVSCGDLAATMAVLLRVGPLGRVLRENPHLRADAEPRLRAVLARREARSRVALKAATWVVSAQA